MLPVFFEDATFGRLRSGNAPGVARVDARFFLQAFLQRDFLPADVPALPGGTNSPRGTNSRIIAERVAVILGSTTNTGTFVILEDDINNIKQIVRDLTFLSSVTNGNCRTPRS
jgi:hypothetical protein